MSNNIVELIGMERPDPLESGKTGSLLIAVRGAQAAAYCKELVFSVPCGDTAEAVFSTKNGKPVISVSSPYWSMLGVKARLSDEKMSGEKTEWYDFTVQCKDPSGYKLDYGLVFQIEGTVNQLPGTACIQAVATCSADGKEYEDTDVLLIAFQKACAKFYLKNFTAVDADAPLIPCTEFSRKSKIKLSWESNGSYYRVYAGKQVVYSGTETYCILDQKIKANTTFFLEASLVEFTEAQNQENGFLPVVLYDNLGITITDQELAVSKLTTEELNTGKFNASEEINLRGVTNILGNFHSFGGYTTLEAGTYESFKCYICTTDLLIFGFPDFLDFEDKEHLVIWQERVESRGRNFVCRLVKANTPFFLISTLKYQISFDVIYLGKGEIRKLENDSEELVSLLLKI